MSELKIEVTSKHIRMAKDDRYHVASALRTMLIEVNGKSIKKLYNSYYEAFNGKRSRKFTNLEKALEYIK